MYCQACGHSNSEEEEFCRRCHQKLLVVSGAGAEEAESFEDGSPEGDFSFDEHLLERISVLEEAVKRTADGLRQLLVAFNKQERSVLVNQTGLATLRELLETHRVLDAEEWSQRWEVQMDYQMLALEKRERFVRLKERIASLYAGSRRQTFDRLLEDAEYALFAFDIERALRALETAFRLDRDNYELAYFIGETYFNDGASERALPYLARVLESSPDHYEALVYAGVVHHERGDTGRAEELLGRALAVEPEAFLPAFSLGAVCASRGDLKRAVVLLERAVACDPVPQALFLLGSCLYEMGKTTRAIRVLEQTARVDPGHEEALHLLGLAYLDRGWNRKALLVFRQAEELNPKRMRYGDLVRCLSGQASSPLPRVGGEAGRWLDKAEESLRRGGTDRALSLYRQALAADPDNPTLLISFALACLKLDRPRETEAVTRRLLDSEDDEMLRATAYAALIESLRAEGRYREGNAIGRKLLEEGTSTFARTVAYYEMAYNLAEMEEDLDQALDFAQRSLDHSPDELKQFPLAALGWVHFKRQELEEAVDFLSRSTDLDPSAPTLSHLGLALLAAGDDRRARSVMAQARGLEGRTWSLEQKMMECMKDTDRLIERSRRQPRG